LLLPPLHVICTAYDVSGVISFEEQQNKK